MKTNTDIVQLTPSRNVNVQTASANADVRSQVNSFLLLIRPAITALAAGNCCVLKLSEAVKATSALLLKLIPEYFEPDAVTAMAGHREETTELLQLPFDYGRTIKERFASVWGQLPQINKTRAKGVWTNAYTDKEDQDGKDQ